MYKLIRVMEPQKHLLVAISICLLLIVTTIYIIQSDDETLRTAITLIQVLLCCLTIAYLIYSIIKRRRRYHADMEKNQFAYAMQSHLFGASISNTHIKYVLSQIREFVQADLVHYAIMDGAASASSVPLWSITMP